MSEEKAKYWWAVLYPENMIKSWQDDIAEVLQLPFAYCVHDKDTLGHDGDRKKHIHLIVVWNNNTTYNAAFRRFAKLNAEGKQAFNKIEVCGDIKHCFDYLIHDTDNCRKKGKYQYPKEERIEGNNFDIGAYAQVSLGDKRELVKKLSRELVKHKFTDYVDWFEYVCNLDDMLSLEVALSYSGHFERLCKGMYHSATRSVKQKQAMLIKAAYECKDDMERISKMRYIELGVDPDSGEMLNPFDQLEE